MIMWQSAEKQDVLHGLGRAARLRPALMWFPSPVEIEIQQLLDATAFAVP
jgi:hypothetical protein